jgi:serine acetyltransferase
MRIEGDLQSRHRIITDAPPSEASVRTRPPPPHPAIITPISKSGLTQAPAEPPKMTFREIIREAGANSRFASRALIFSFRLAQRCNRILVLCTLARSLHRIVSLILRVELPPETAIAPGLRIERPFAIVIHPATRIGARCLLRHGVTLDARFDGDDMAPVIGNDVQFGPYCVAMGPVEVSDHAHVPPLSQLMQVRATSLAAAARDN